MSGLEVAGVALAVVPILLSAAEHYDDVHRPLVRLFKFSRELKLYCKRLKTHSTIFREECRLLLGRVVRDEEVIEMLSASSHPLWNDEDVERGLVELLSTSREACINTIGMIKNILGEIEHEVGELCEVASKNGTVLASFTYVLMILACFNVVLSFSFSLHHGCEPQNQVDSDSCITATDLIETGGRFQVMASPITEENFIQSFRSTGQKLVPAERLEPGFQVPDGPNLQARRATTQENRFSYTPTVSRSEPVSTGPEGIEFPL